MRELTFANAFVNTRYGPTAGSYGCWSLISEVPLYGLTDWWFGTRTSTATPLDPTESDCLEVCITQL